MLKIVETSPSAQHIGALRVRLSPGQKVSKKYKKQLWKRECKNLKAIVPTVANKNVSEVEVIEQAVDYIEHLHQAIADRLGVLPCNQMITALHRMAQLKQVAQANARMPQIMPSAYLQPSTNSHLIQRSTSQTSQNCVKVMTPVRL